MAVTRETDVTHVGPGDQFRLRVAVYPTRLMHDSQERLAIGGGTIHPPEISLGAVIGHRHRRGHQDAADGLDSGHRQGDARWLDAQFLSDLCGMAVTNWSECPHLTAAVGMV